MHKIIPLLPLSFIGLLLVVFTPSGLSAQSAENEVKVDSEISSVTVYLEGAQVNRKADFRVANGRSTLVFTGLTAKSDPRSIQVTLENPSVQVLSVSHRINFAESPAEDPEEAALFDQIKILDKKERRLRTEVELGKEEEAILQANRQLTGEQTALSAEDLERSVRFHRERLTAIRLSYLAIADSLELIAEDRKRIQEEISQRGLERQRPAVAEIVVEVESDGPAQGPVGLAYLVADASWTPTYDVRIDDISQPVDLRYRARVNQRSGEDWKDVNLTLSTGDPNQSAVAPELPVWRLSAGSRPPVYRPQPRLSTPYAFKSITGVVTDENREAVIGATVLVEGTEIGTVTDLNGNFTLDVPADRQKLIVSYVGYSSQVVLITPGVQDIQLNESAAALDEVVVVGSASGIRRSNMMQRRSRSLEEMDIQADMDPSPITYAVPTTVERRATTVSFVVELPYDIPSGGEARTVDIRDYRVPATYRHLAVPKLSPDVYLTAALTDWESYDLISGELQLFFEGTFLGTSTLDVSNTTDTLSLSLGRDPGVIVLREKDLDYGRRGGVLSNKRVESRGYKISIRNTKDRPVNLVLRDQLPIPAYSEIEVNSDLPGGVKHNERTGILTWEIALQPRAEKDISFGYSVKYPKGQRLFLE